MSGSGSADFQAILYEALGEPIGLLCNCEPSFEIARQRLYAARTKAADPDLAALQFRASPLSGGNLLIIKETVELRRDAKKE